MNLSVSLGRLQLPNPILVASGTFGYAREAAPWVPLARLGGIIPKTVTVTPRRGNATPRIVETPSGMLNAIGLDNDGVEYFLANHLPYLRTVGAPVIVNVAGKSAAEFEELATRVAGQPGIAALELNLSCPNVAGGIDFATRPEVTQQVVGAVRARCPLPILAKLTPNVTDIVSIARAAQEGGADAVTLTNTVLGTAVDWRRRRPILANVFGGLSGPAIKPITLRMVMQVRRALTIPIVGVGGIATIDDAMVFIVAGASAIQLGTVNYINPQAACTLLDALPDALAGLGVSALAEAVGTLKW